MCKCSWRRFLTIILSLFLVSCPGMTVACQLFGATGSVTRDSITILAKARDMYWMEEQRIWFSPRTAHGPEDSIHFRHISIPQCSLTYKFIATNSIVENQTTGYGINEYGFSIVSHDMDSWDDDSLGAEYFHDQDYVALSLARCRNAWEAIDLFDELIVPQGINAEAYLLADSNGLWLLETTGFNYAAKPISDDVISSRLERFNIRTEWNAPGNRQNSDLMANAQAHGCNTDTLDFAACFGNRPPGVCDADLLALKERGNITVQDMRALVSDKAIDGTVSACVIPVRPEKDLAYFSLMWDSRANPKYGNVFLPYWMAITDTSLPGHYTSWPPDAPDCAWNIFTAIVQDSLSRTTTEPIWREFQNRLEAEFDTVETSMQAYLGENDLAGLQQYIDDYVYGTLDSAYGLAMEIINGVGTPELIQDLAIHLAGEDMVLTWSAVTVDLFGNPLVTDHYRLYRDTISVNWDDSRSVDSTTALSYVDSSGVVGDAEINYYYTVTAVSGGKESRHSKMLGEFDHHVTAVK